MNATWRFNDGIAAVLLLLVAISPLPLGSNRPVFWAISATLVFAIMAIFLIGTAMRSRKFTIRPRQIWLISALALTLILFIGAQVFAGLSITSRASLLALLRTLSYGAFFFMVLQVSTNPQRAKWMLTGLFYACAIYAVVGFFIRFGTINLPEIFGTPAYEGNATATFVNRNSFATYLGFGLLVGLALITRRARELRSGARGTHMGGLKFSDMRLATLTAASALIFVTLIATNSRMGVAALIVAAVAFLLALAIKRAGGKLTVFAIVVALLLTITGLIFLLYGQTLLERLGSVENDADVRFALYRQVWTMIMARPWTGFGADSFEIAFQQFHHLPVSPDLVWDKAHNTYLTNWAEHGLIVGSIPLLLLAILFARFVRTAFARRRNFVVPLLGASVILQGALHSLVDFSLEIQANVYFLLAILAIALADVLIGKSRKKA